jgi:hypothetical protein
MNFRTPFGRGWPGLPPLPKRKACSGIHERLDRVPTTRIYDPAGFVTFVGFTCQWGEALSARMSIFQCLIAPVAEANQLGNCLFLANVLKNSQQA